MLTYTRSIEFAHLVTLMADVVFRVHPSVRAAYRHSPEPQAAARLKSFYEKFNHLEPAVCRAFVQQMARRCVELVEALGFPGRSRDPGSSPMSARRQQTGRKPAAVATIYLQRRGIENRF